MIEMIFLLCCAVIIGSWFVAVVLLITLRDLRIIALENERRRHPYARKWRGVTRLRRKLRVHGDEQSVPQKSFRFALAQFQANPAARFVEMIPYLAFPTTLQGLFVAYHSIALSPFIKVRAAANILPTSERWPQLKTRKRITGRLDAYYGLYVWLLQATNLLILLYVSYLMFAADQSGFLLAYIMAFGVWLAWSITNHPLLVWRQKVAYLVLAPTSFGYFLWRVIVAPFAPLLVPLRKIPLISLVRQML